MNGGSERDLIDSLGEFVFAWDFSSPPAVLLLLLAGAYIAGSIRLSMRSKADRSFWAKVAASLTGFALLAVALAGPFDFYSGELFAAHMSQHIVIAMLAAPLLLIARPMPAYIWALPRSLRTGAGTALTDTGFVRQDSATAHPPCSGPAALHRHAVRLAHPCGLQRFPGERMAAPVHAFHHVRLCNSVLVAHCRTTTRPDPAFVSAADRLPAVRGHTHSIAGSLYHAFELCHIRVLPRQSGTLQLVADGRPANRRSVNVDTRKFRLSHHDDRAFLQMVRRGRAQIIPKNHERQSSPADGARRVVCKTP